MQFPSAIAFIPAHSGETALANKMRESKGERGERRLSIKITYMHWTIRNIIYHAPFIGELIVLLDRIQAICILTADHINIVLDHATPE